MLQWMTRFFARHSATLFFPAALILYDFAAYLTTDLIQPGIIHVVRDFDADVALAPASVSLYMVSGMALQWLLGPLSDRIGTPSGAAHRRADLYPGLLRDPVHHLNGAVPRRALCSGHQHLFYRYGWLRHRAGGVRYQTKAIKLMAIITSIVLIAPIIGPLSGAALMHFVHWKVLFGIIAVMGFIAWLGLLLNMPETVRRGDVPFSASGVLRDFRDVFRNRVFQFGAATLSLSYIPLMSWVAVSPVILIDDGGLTTAEFAWTQVPVFSAVIIANLSVARWVKDPTRPRFIWRAVPIQMTGLAILILGNLLCTARLAVVGDRHLLLRLRHRADLPDTVPLYPVFKRSAKGHRFRFAEYRDP